MKEYELSDRKLKIGVVLAMVIIGWMCLKGASASRAQTTPANLSPRAQQVVLTPVSGAKTLAGPGGAAVTGW